MPVNAKKLQQPIIFAPMKKLFYIGIAGLILFEIANIYFIMYLPGSQEMNAVNFAYFLYTWRWVFRAVFGAMIIAGSIPVLKNAEKKPKTFPLVLLVLLGAIVYSINFNINPDTKFIQTENLEMKPAAENTVDTNRIIIGIENNGQAKAYPIQFLGYHHLVFDTIGGKPIVVTYCIICRSGRVFEPIVNGKPEHFKLVGINHDNAILQDKTTESWWQQSTGEAITGSLKGKSLPEFSSSQMALKQWLALYPNSLIMQPDKNYLADYKSLSNYETGNEKKVSADTVSWQEKSWVAGIKMGNESKAYDWKTLQRERIIYDVLASQPIALILAADNKSFTALQRVNELQKFILRNDTLYDGQNSYNLMGTSFNPTLSNLKKINVSQENWFSWQTFHPDTKRY